MRITLLILCLLLTACGRQPSFPPLPAGATIVILGDSLTYGTGAREEEAYPSLLAANTGWKIINGGVPGDTSADGLVRLPSLLEGQQADLLLIALGGNDFLRRVPDTVTIDNLKSALSHAKSQGIQTAVIAVPQFSPLGAAVGTLSDHPLYAGLAKEADVPLIENVFSPVLAKNAWKSDPIHPNAQGYREVERRLREALIELGLIAKSPS